MPAAQHRLGAEVQFLAVDGGEGAHNAQYPDYATNVQLLNLNVIAWLTSVIVVNGKVIPTHVQKKYQDCLNAPNYTVFSNTTSAAQWNENLASGAELVVPIESPHNSIHLSVGGCDVPNYDRSPIEGANGAQAVADNAQYDVEVRTRDGLLSQPRAVAAALTPRRPFHFEVR